MPEMDGLEVQQELNARGISMPVVVLTGHGDVSIAVRAMKAGAVDFLEKPFEEAVLLAAIETAFERLQSNDLQSDRAAEATVRLAGLTSRERDVLAGLARGLPTTTTPSDLHTSPPPPAVHPPNPT